MNEAVEYLLIFLANALISLTMVLNKSYEKRAGCSLAAGLSFSMQSGFMIALIYYGVNGFRMQVTTYSLIISAVYALAVTAYTILGFYMLRDGAVATYTMFLMAGGMSVPYLWGLLFLEEPFSFLRTIGILAVIAGIVLANYRKEGGGVKYLLLGFVIFFLNGFVSVLSKVHQIETVHPIVSSMEFVILTSLVRGAVSLLLLVPVLFWTKKGERKTPSAPGWGKLGLIALIAVVTGISSFLLVRGATNLPATVLYPINTGGTIVFSAIMGRLFFREKLPKRQLGGILLCVAGTCCFL